MQEEYIDYEPVGKISTSNNVRYTHQLMASVRYTSKNLGCEFVRADWCFPTNRDTHHFTRFVNNLEEELDIEDIESEFNDEYKEEASHFIIEYDSARDIWKRGVELAKKFMCIEDEDGNVVNAMQGAKKQIEGKTFTRFFHQVPQMDWDTRKTAFDYKYYLKLAKDRRVSDELLWPEGLFNLVANIKILSYPYTTRNGLGETYDVNTQWSLNYFNGDGSIYSLGMRPELVDLLVNYVEKYDFDISYLVARNAFMFVVWFDYTFDTLWTCKTSRASAEKWLERANKWLDDNGYRTGLLQARIIPFIYEER